MSTTLLEQSFHDNNQHSVLSCDESAGMSAVADTVPMRIRIMGRKELRMNREEPSIAELIGGIISVAGLVATLWLLAYIL